ncbi:MAG: hypothetical protein R6T93_02585 [Trueperaceae bacterium]
MSQRRAAAVIAMHRSTLRYQSTLGVKDAPLKERTCEIAGVRVWYG